MTLDAAEPANASEEALLKRLRRNSNQVKSFDDIVSLLHATASEQKASSMLRSCMDKVLISMNDVHSLRDMLDKLRSVARTNDLLFQFVMDKDTTRPETRCQIVGDMFKVEIVLDGQDSHFCLDVKVYHLEHARSSPELVEIIRSGKFLALSKHLKHLIAMYPMSMDRATKTRVCLALQSLEMDIARMAQIYKESHSDYSNLQIVMNGSVGLLAPHVPGKNAQLHYFLSPHDLIDPKTKQMITTFDQMPDNKGLHAEMKAVSHVAHNLPISPLIANNHPLDDTGQPRFAEVNQHNSVVLPACFVLQLQPPIPISVKIAEDIEKETSISVYPAQTDLQSYLSLILKQSHHSEVTLGEYTHRYHLEFEQLKAAMVEEIHFTHPGHIVSILSHLRKQAYFNTIIGSCVRAKPPMQRSDTVDWYFDVSADKDLTKLNITFEHPLSVSSTAFAEISLSPDGFSSCHLFTARGDPSLCSDQHATRVLQKTFSLPVTMRNVVQQAKRQPRKEPDRGRMQTGRHSSLHPSVTSSFKKQHISSIPKPPQVAPATTAVTNPFVSVARASSTAAASNVTGSHVEEKETKHPMLTKLLKPSNDSSVAPKPNHAVPAQKNRLLLTLLSENDPNASTDGFNKAAQQQKQFEHQHAQAPQQQPQQHPPYQQHQELTQQYSGGPNMQQQQQMQGFFPQQRTAQMPPPPSYPTSIPVKAAGGQQQYQPVMQQNLYQSQPSPLSLVDLSGPLTPSLTSPSFMSQPSSSHAITPPLVATPGMAPSPITQSMPSPLCPPSPMHPPMNTPQPLPMTSPMHSAMTPPIPSPRKPGRRTPRQKSQSLEATTSNPPSVGEIKQEFDFGFPSFDDTSTMMDIFSDINPHLTSPTVGSTNQSTMQQNFANNNTATSFSFDSEFDFGIGLARKTSVGRRLSNQAPSFMSSAMPLQDNQEFGREPSQGMSEAQLQQMQQQLLQQQSLLNNSNRAATTSDTFGADFRDDLSRSTSLRTPTSVTRTFSQSSEQPESDPFTFDDSTAPSKISMPDSNQPRISKSSISLSRQTSSSSVTDEPTLKTLLGNSPGLVSALTGSGVSKTHSSSKMDKPGSAMLQSLLSKSQRRSSEDGVVHSSTGMPGGALISGHRQLIRQNAVSKTTTQVKSQSSMPNKPGEAKEKPRKRAATKDDGSKPAPKRRGRPPSTDKKEYPAKRKKVDNGSEDCEARGKIVLNVQFNKGTPISSTTKTKPLPPEGSNSGEKSIASNSAATATGAGSSSAPSASSDLDKFYSGAGMDMQRYLKSQVEMDKKKKERILVSGSSSPVTPARSKGNGKFPPLSSAKTSSGTGGKATVSSVQKSQVSPQLKSGAAPRPRKNSLKDVVDMLHADQSPKIPQAGSSGHSRGATAFQNQSAQKSTEKPSSSGSESPGLPKLKSMLVAGSKAASSQSPKLGSKSPTEERSLKTSSLSKPGITSKSPSLVSKSGSGTGRMGAAPKKDPKPRPVTPQRDGKGFATAQMTKTSPKTQNSPSVMDPKLKSTLSKIQESAAAIAKSVMVGPAGELAKQRMGMMGRTNGGGKSPGRSITPPQVKGSFPTNAQQAHTRPDSALQALLKAKKSPSHAAAAPISELQKPASMATVELGDDGSSKSASQKISPPLVHARKPSSADSALNPPPAKRLAPSPAVPAPRLPPPPLMESPMSPDNQLVIDDGSQASRSDNSRMVTPVPSSAPNRIASPVVPVLPTPSEPTAVSLVSLMQTADGFDASPNVRSPREIDNDLMDEALLL